MSYNLRVGTRPGGNDIITPNAGTNGYRQLTELGNAGLSRSASVTNLKPGANYYCSVQAVGTAFAGGPFAEEGSFTVSAPATPTLLLSQRLTIGFRLEALGTPGWSYAFLATANVAASNVLWTRLGSAAADAGGRLGLMDTNTNVSQRF